MEQLQNIDSDQIKLLIKMGIVKVIDDRKENQYD